jgi:GNAT superfamily N-acetyltransferase
MRLAVQQPTHTVRYMDFKGRIAEGYGKGDVELARRDKAEVLRSSDDEVRFNVYPGKEVEEYALRRTKGNQWLIQNVTTSRQVGPGKALPSSKPAYRTVAPEKLKTDDPGTELQAKIDGAHVLYHFKRPGQTPRVVSYRPTERATGVIEHTHKIPGFHRLSTPSSLRDTIVRGELYAVDQAGKALPAARVGGILNAGVWRSREKQQQEGRLVPVAFDIVRYRGKDVENEPYSVKRKLLDSIRKLAPWLKKPRTATTATEKEKLVFDIMHGLEPSTEEGVVELRQDRPVPAKSKFLRERDVFVRDVFPEEGTKRRGTMAGGFEYSTSPKGPIVGRVGTGFSHALKKDMLEHPDKYRGLRARVMTQPAPAHYAPRAASFHSFHIEQEMPENVKTAVSRQWIRHAVDTADVSKNRMRAFIREMRKVQGRYGHKAGRAGKGLPPYKAMIAEVQALGRLRHMPEGVKTAAATATLRRTDDGIAIEKLSVPREERGQGKARKLLSYIKDRYKGASIYIRPRPFGDMPMSIDQLKGFYESEGFQAVDGRDNMVLKTAQAQGWWRGDPMSPGGVKFKRDYQGITIHIDRPKGFVMKGTDDKGNEWTRKYQYDYGFIPKTKGGDGEGLDVFLGPDKKAPEAYWAVQVKSDGTFDEYKVFLGFPDREAAISAYRQHIPKKLMRGMVSMRIEMMKAMMGIDSNGLIKKTATAPAMVGFHDELAKIAKVAIPLLTEDDQVAEALKRAKEVSREGMRKRLAQAASELTSEIQQQFQ